MQRLLAISDDTMFQDDLKDALPGVNRVLFAATDARSALRQLERDAPDLVMLCLDLASGAALELLLSIRGTAPDLPVIAMAAIQRPQYDKRLSAALHLGANMALAKPIEPKILFEAIDRLIGSAA